MADGLLDFLKTAEGQGLLSLAAGGLAGARRGQPINSLGRAGLAGLAGYGNALDRQTQEAQVAQAQEFRNMQMRQMQQQEQQKQLNQEVFSRLTSPQASEPRVSMNEMGLPVVDQPSVQTPGKFDPMRAVQMGMSPDAVANFQKIYESTQPKTEVYKPGDVVFQGGRQVMSIPKEDSIPAAVKEYQFAVSQGYQGPFQQFELDKRRAGATRTMINMGQEKEEAKVVGKEFGQQFSDIQKAGFTAQSTVNRYDRLGQLLEGVNTGKFSPLGLEVSKAAQAAGINIDPKLQNKEAAVALSNEIALQLRNPAGGAGMPGALSDKDREFLVSMVPGLGTTADGRKLMIETGKKIAKRDMDVAKLARDYRKKNGTLDEGFYDVVNDFAQKNPLFEQKQSAPAMPSDGVLFLGFE
jgi:hypothetical protein